MTGDILGRPFAEVSAELNKAGLPCSVSETHTTSRFFRVAPAVQYIVRCTGDGRVVTCAKQVYSDSVNACLRAEGKEEYVIE
ncbi:MAG: hypothetical protein MR209_03200 [Veillonellaceae bacterium]|nr:hypothetical protein [Veillonellaceae bacterium]